MEQEEKDSYVKTYHEGSEEARKVLAEFMKKMSVEIVGNHAKNWLKAVAILTQIEEPTQGLLDALTKFLPKPAGNLYPVSVDYGRSVADGILAGQYDWVNVGIVAPHFPTKKSGMHEVKIELIHFDREISTEDALSEIDTRGYRPADLHELLAFGSEHSEIQWEFPIVALGSVWQARDGNRLAPYLDRDDRVRGLDLGWVKYDWLGFYRFAVVRK